MYLLIFSIALLLLALGILLLRKNRGVQPRDRTFLWVPAMLGSGICFGMALSMNGTMEYAPVDREDCVVAVRSFGGYSVKYVTAFDQMVPLVGTDRMTLSGMPIDWNDGKVIGSKAGDTICVYLMREVDSKFMLFKDTIEFLCVNKGKMAQHEYDLFLQTSSKGIKEELKPELHESESGQ